MKRDISLLTPEEKVITPEEGYELTKFYVNYYWATKKFYSLANQYEVEDLVSEIYIKFLEKHLFEKYDASITSKKYHVMNSVRTSLIDMLRKYREHISLDAVAYTSSTKDSAGEQMTVGDLIPSNEDMEKQALGQVARDRIIEQIPDTTDSKLVGHSPIYGTVNFSLRTIALHLEQGFTTDDICKMFINEKSGRPITNGSVNKMIQKLREYVLDNIVIA